MNKKISGLILCVIVASVLAYHFLNHNAKKSQEGEIHQITSVSVADNVKKEALAVEA